MCEHPLALVGLRRPPPLRRLPASTGHGGVFVPPLSSAAPSVSAASYTDPRFAPPPPGSAPGGSSAHALPPRFSSAPPGTPRDSGSEDSDSDSSSASAALDSAAVQLADLVYDFCPIPLLHLDAVLSRGLTPRRLHPPLGLATAFTLGLLR